MPNAVLKCVFSQRKRNLDSYELAKSSNPFNMTQAMSRTNLDIEVLLVYFKAVSDKFLDMINAYIRLLLEVGLCLWYWYGELSKEPFILA